MIIYTLHMYYLYVDYIYRMVGLFDSTYSQGQHILQSNGGSKLLTPKMMVRITWNTQHDPKCWSQTVTVAFWALDTLMYLSVYV